MRKRSTGGGTDYLHSYGGSRPLADFNTCGQAAVAAVLDFHGLDPYGLDRPVYDEKDGRYHWRDERIVDRIKERFPRITSSGCSARAVAGSPRRWPTPGSKRA